MTLANVNAPVAALRPYQPGKPIEELVRERGVEDAIKLGSNENPRGPGPGVREALDARFAVKLGRWRVEPVGPHPVPMYQVAFTPDQFDGIVRWLMLNRRGLTVLVHPETGHDLEDHRDRALWMGRMLDLNFDVLG